jgi:hypothetical protein
LGQRVREKRVCVHGHRGKGKTAAVRREEGKRQARGSEGKRQEQGGQRARRAKKGQEDYEIDK